MASVGWQIGAGGTPVAVPSLSRISTTYSSATQPRRATKAHPALSAIFPLRQISRGPKRALSPLLVPKRVEAPESADCVVLVSSDGANFRVSRTVLAYASPVFQRLFSIEKERLSVSPISSKSPIKDETPLCLTDESLVDRTPLIRLSETSKTLDALLRHLYPFPPSPSSLFNQPPNYVRVCIDDVKPVLLAAHKYVMRPIIDDLCSRLLSDLSLSTSNCGSDSEGGEGDLFSLRVYALACSIGKTGLAQAAAYAALCVPATGVYFPELEEISAMHYFRLLEYHRICTEAVIQLLRSWECSKIDDEKLFDARSKCGKCDDRTWSGTFRSRAETIVRESPRSQRIFSPDFITDNSQRDEKYEGSCRNQFPSNWRAASVALKEQIERTLLKVELDLSALEPSPVKSSSNKEKKPDS